MAEDSREAWRERGGPKSKQRGGRWKEPWQGRPRQDIGLRPESAQPGRDTAGRTAETQESPAIALQHAASGSSALFWPSVLSALLRSGLARPRDDVRPAPCPALRKGTCSVELPVRPSAQQLSAFCRLLQTESRRPVTHASAPQMRVGDVSRSRPARIVFADVV